MVSQAKSEWSGRDRPPSGQAVGYVVLNFRIHRDEDGYFVGECEDLGVSSFGATLTEAMDATMEAAEAYLEAIDDLSERTRVFAEKGLTFYEAEPPAGMQIAVTAHPGEYVSPQRLAVAAC